MNDAANADLRQFMREQASEILQAWRQRLLATGGNHVRGLTPMPELNAEMSALLQGLSDALGQSSEYPHIDHDQPLAETLRSASHLRAARGFTPEESLLFIQTGKEAMLDRLYATNQGTQESVMRITRLTDHCSLILAAAFMAAREEVIKRQSESLREVSTPVITLWDSMLLLPLVGIVDSVRAQQISESLLVAISESEAEVTLIDVTGVPIMDTSVARHILKTVAAAEMLGTRVILTGISPSTAQTMVKLGIDMSGVPTRGSLKSGVALALSMTRRRVVEVAAPARA
jgi:rsbT co-antagonist protein RsbR